MTNKNNQEIQNQAMKVAKATQRIGQTKEQTKLIARGIEKGIAEYKKQQNKKARERNKLRKSKLKVISMTSPEPEPEILSNKKEIKAIKEIKAMLNNILPWILLILSWVSFFIYINYI